MASNDGVWVTYQRQRARRVRAGAVSQRERWHGTRSGYTNHGCRCDECRAANTQYQKHARIRRAIRLALDPSLAAHGTLNAYLNWGCRCDDCRAANAAYERDRYQRRKAAP